jgi:hypothetical protein
MTTPTTFRTHRVRNGSLVGGVAALAGAAAIAAALAFGGGDTEVDGARQASDEAILSSLPPEQRRYVEWVVAATPEQLAAAFGGPVQPTPLKAGVTAR